MNYPLVNRCAVAVAPKPPFWEWVKKTGEIRDDRLRDTKDINVYLQQGIFDAGEYLPIQDNWPV